MAVQPKVKDLRTSFTEFAEFLRRFHPLLTDDDVRNFWALLQQTDMQRLEELNTEVALEAMLDFT